MNFSKTIAGIILSCCLVSINAQETIKSLMIHPTSVTLINKSSPRVYGALYQVKDSSILISDSRKSIDYSFYNPNFTISEFYVTDIKRIRSNNKIRFLSGMLIGAATGFATGYIIGWSSDPGWFTQRQNAIFGGIAMSTIGTLVGGIVGSVGFIIPIDGSMDNYNRKKARLNKLSLMK